MSLYVAGDSVRIREGGLYDGDDGIPTDAVGTIVATKNTIMGQLYQVNMPEHPYEGDVEVNELGGDWIVPEYELVAA